MNGTLMGAIVIVVAFLLIVVIMNWEFLSPDVEHANIQFKHFAEMYWVNPNKWQFHKRTVVYNFDTVLGFNLIDRVKYSLWRKHLISERKKNDFNRDVLAVVQDCKKDIDKLEKDAEEEIEKAKEITERINEHWKRNGGNN